jgi:tRNA threonylcarbamoyladenosine biosynthesis protein TsaE
MPCFTIESSSPEATAALGAALGRLLRKGDMVCLKGPLGAGKTVFVRGLAEGLGVPEMVSSPGFVIVHEHPGPGERSLPGPVPFYHIDLYRLTPEQTLELGLETYFEGGGMCAVEWADHLPPSFQLDCLEISFSFGSGEEARILRPSAETPRGTRLLEEFKRAAKSRQHTPRTR